MNNVMSKPTKTRMTKVLVFIALISGALFAGFPVLWMVSSSFKPNTEIFAYPPRLTTASSSLGAYLSVLTDPEKVRFFVNSYFVASAVALLTLIVGTLAGYSFSRYDFRFKKPLNMIIISVQAVPPITLLIPYFSLIVTLKLFNTYAALILTYMVFTLPYAIIMMTGYFNTLPRALDEAVQATLKDRAGDPFLQELVVRYGRPADALALKRNRRVWGSCSMDDSPRLHTLDIATLAAESVNWDIFLRAHLDILNDRFDRASDGSYAQAGRQTYVLELEELEIDVPDLLLGTLLRAENTNAGHYVASANRTGRASTEAKEAGAIAARLLAMIADPELDLYNRAVLYYAYLNYNGHLQDEAVQERNEKALELALAGIPKELRGKRR